MDGSKNITAESGGETLGFIGGGTSDASQGLIFSSVAAIVVALANTANGGGLTVENTPKLVGDLVGAFNQRAPINIIVERPPTAELIPAVPIKKSITPDAIISLEDGKPYQTLKRHLATRGMTPDQYRAKWGLPSDYPMVAANYSSRRSALAREAGLGIKTAATPAPVEAKTARRKKAA